MLDTFDAELCAAVSGREDARFLLDRLVAADLFVVPLDDVGRWNRYHHLFGAFLRARLASHGRSSSTRQCTSVPVALSKARGDVNGALRHAMTVGDFERVGNVLRRSLDRDMSLSDADVARLAIRSWLHEFGADLIETNPIWVVEFLIGLMSIARPDERAIGGQTGSNRRIRIATGELCAVTEGGQRASRLQG